MNSFKTSQFGESQNDPEPKRCGDSTLGTAAQAEAEAAEAQSAVKAAEVKSAAW